MISGFPKDKLKALSGYRQLNLNLVAMIFFGRILGIKHCNLFPLSESVDVMKENVDCRTLVMNRNGEIAQAGEGGQKSLKQAR